MQIFELYFNPKKENKIAESFCHKPQNVYERKLGKLYVVGEISGIKNKDRPFLQNIFHTAKEKYYSDTSLAPDKALGNTLKEINHILKNSDYQGKLNIALFSSKNFFIYFAKIGEIKIILLKKKQIKDIGKELESAESNLFQNMVSGRMKKEEKLLVLTPEIYHSFSKGKLLEKMLESPLSEKMMEKIAALQKEKFPNASGVSLIIDHSLTLKEDPQVVFGNGKKAFSFRKLLHNALLPLEKAKSVKLSPPRINLGSILNGFRKKLQLPGIKLPDFKKKPLLLPLILLAVLLIGYMAISIENSIRTSRQKEILFEIEENIIQGKKKEDIILLKDMLSQLERLKEKRTLLGKEIEEAYVSLEKELLELSMWKEIEDMELIADIEEINPEGIVLANNTIYLYNPRSPEIIGINRKTGEKNPYSLPVQGINYSSFSGNRTILFSKPNNLLFLEREKLSLFEIPRNNHTFISLSTFHGIPYLLTAKGEIITYQNEHPEIWIKEEEKRVNNSVSMAIDGAIYVLDKENKIHRYYKGEYEEEIVYTIFPEFAARKIYTSPQFPFVFLDKEEKRIIIANKEGEVEKQLYSEKLSNPRDLAVSPEENKIYLLDEQKVYSITLE